MQKERERRLELFNDDCLEKLKEIDTNKEETVIITSPPYNMNLRVRGNGYMKRGFENSISEVIATKYKNYRDDLPMEEYYAFQKQFIDLALEKAGLVFYNVQMVTGNKVALFKLLGTFCDKIKEVIVWDKMLGQPAVRAGCMNSRFEFLFILSDISPSRRAFEEPMFERGKLDNIWQIRVGKHKGMKAGWPEEFVERIIDSFVPRHYTVIDPYMGSGTAGVVCKRKGIDFVGIERDQETFEMAEKRIYEVEEE